MRGAQAKLQITDPAPETSLRQFSLDVRRSLSSRPLRVPSRYLYDSLGSALFAAIGHLPWYHVTRAETRLLRERAQEIVGSLSPLTRVVELGSGSGDKLAVLLAESQAARNLHDLHLVDVSAAALSTAARAVAGFDRVRVVAHQAPYEVGLERTHQDPAGAGHTLTLLLGSNIGNFDAQEAGRLLRRVHQSLRTGDGFLLGADLVKPEADLLRAYDDPIGVTAAFNLNLISRLNRELGADIDLGSFSHRAIWNQEASRVEMHLVSTRTQRLQIPVAQVDLTMSEGETIWTESSYKYEPAALEAMLAEAGFGPQAQWVDEAARFALTLVRVR